jgi:hypothetical protein
VFRLTVPRTLGQELVGSPLPLGPDEAELAGGGPLAGRPGAAVAGFGLADVVGSGGTPAEVLPDGDGHLAAIDKRVTAGNGRLAVGNESPAAGNGGSAAGNGSLTSGESVAAGDGRPSSAGDGPAGPGGAPRGKRGGDG